MIRKTKTSKDEMYLQEMETFEISIKTALTDWKLCIQYKSRETKTR